MFRGYQLNSVPNFTPSQVNAGEKIYSTHKEQFRKSISEHLNDHGNVNASSVEAEWFPQIDADIFISHSSKDKKYVYGLAGWFKEKFGLTAFVDSAIWGNSELLLREIDDAYCKLENSDSYSYTARNYSTSHVHLILSMALTKMIDKSECIIFYNTPNSVTINKPIEQTTSPWIYSEVTATQLLRRQSKRSVINKIAFSESDGKTNDFPQFNYEIPLKHLPKLTDETLIAWLTMYNNDINEHALDILYTLK